MLKLIQIIGWLVLIMAACAKPNSTTTTPITASTSHTDSLQPFAHFVYDSSAIQADVDFVVVQADSAAFAPLQEGLYRPHVIVLLGHYDAFCRLNHLPIDSNSISSRLNSFFDSSNLPISHESTVYYYKNTDKTYTQEVFYGKEKGFIIVEYGFK